MEEPMELLIPASNSPEQDDSDIEELLSSFYFDNPDKQHSAQIPSRHAGATFDHLNPIYEETEEDEMFYSLYATQDETPCSTSGSSNSDDDSSSEFSSQCGPRLPLGMISDPSNFWPVIEEDDEVDATSSSSGIVVEEDVEDEDEEDLEWEQRGRSRAVPARLMRWARDMGKAQIQRQRLGPQTEDERQE